MSQYKNKLSLNETETKIAVICAQLGSHVLMTCFDVLKTTGKQIGLDHPKLW